MFFNRLGEIRVRSFEQQRCRASGINLVTAAIVSWNTVYTERSVAALRDHGQLVGNAMLQFLSPLGWQVAYKFNGGLPLVCDVVVPNSVIPKDGAATMDYPNIATINQQSSQVGDGSEISCKALCG